MSLFGFRCLKFCRTSKLYTLFSCTRYKNIISKNISTKLLVGVIPLIPSVSAQTGSIEEKNKPKYVQDNPLSEFLMYDQVSQPEEKTGWEKLCAVFSVDEYGHLSVEMTASLQATSFACFVGLIYGGVMYSRAAFTDFMDRNQASIFENHLDAKRKLQNHVTVHFAKGAFKWSWRLSLFTGSFMLLILSISAYRGKTTVTNYAVSGTVVGALLRWKLGPRGMIAGGTIGLILGTFCGLMTTTLLTLSGHSLDDIVAFQNQLDKNKKDLFNESNKKDLEENHLGQESLQLLKRHENDTSDKPPT